MELTIVIKLYICALFQMDLLYTANFKFSILSDKFDYIYLKINDHKYFQAHNNLHTFCTHTSYVLQE